MTSVDRPGGFDTVRLAAALMVFHSHAFALMGKKEPLLPGKLTFGAAAVSIFFVISGFLVTKSALDRSTISFAIARAIRLWPGLAICCAISIGICSFVSSLSVWDYFSDPNTLSYMRNTFVFWTEMQAGLPGVFEGRQHTAINGSLWTLRYEVFCYVVMACAATFGKKGITITALAAGVFALTILFGGGQKVGIHLLDYLELKWIALLGGAFFFGSSLNWIGERTLPRIIAVAAFAMFLSFRDPGARQIVGTILYGSAALWLSLKLNLDQRLTRGTDLSYGIYIYAFPFQQIAAQTFDASSKFGFTIAYGVSLVATILFAVFSWKLVERPSLKYKNKISDLAETLFGMKTRQREQRRSEVTQVLD